MADQPDVEAGAQQKPALGRGVSMTGREAKFGDADTEVIRILQFESNYYYVLKVRKDTPAGEIKANFYKLSRLVHPDKCSHPRASDAAAILNQAYGTLSNGIKKAAYDAYVNDINVDAPDNMTYAEWEASKMAQQVHVPRWLAAFLRIPGGALILLLILLPLTLVLILLMLVLALVCIPIQAVCRCVCGVQPPPPADANAAHGGMTQEEAAAYTAAKNAGATVPPQQQAPPQV